MKDWIFAFTISHISLSLRRTGLDLYILSQILENCSPIPTFAKGQLLRVNQQTIMNPRPKWIFIS